MKKKFYVTTPIYYPNDVPHIGHAYTTIVADVISRWNKVKGNEVFFLTGTDDHGKKIAQVAEKNGKSPKDFTDELIPKFKEAWKKLDIEYDRFIRTTDKDHEKVVSEVLQKVYDKGDIYLGEYEGFYCIGCEAYYTEKDLEDGCCPIHKTKIEKLKEASYFFKLSKYQKQLLELYKKGFVLPESKKNEVVSRVKEDLRDLSISRTSFDWGIPLPFDKKHVCYVWFDALFNYYSATRSKGKRKFWPADVNLIGKDILWFHAVYWPAFLISAGIDLPKLVFAHGWWTFDKEKISKSRGKVINVDELIAIAGVDAARYFLLRATPFGDDGDFDEKALIDRYNNELADKLGNLVSRVASLIEKNGVEKTDNKLIKKFKEKEIGKKIDDYEFDKALNLIFEFVDVCNEYVQSKKIWELEDSEKKKALYELVESIKKILPYLWCFIPSSSEKIKKQFCADKIKRGEILFRKINKKNEERKTIAGFEIDPELKKKGVNAAVAIISGVNISNKNKSLEDIKKTVVKRLINKSLKNSKVLEGYKEFYFGDKLIPAAESLINLVKKNKRFPNINTLVDSYNLISAESLLSFGAHDIEGIDGEVRFTFTNGKESFVPLDSKFKIKVDKGEYAFRDSEKILCRMDVKQCDETKIAKGTKDVLIYAQGNKNVSQKELDGTLRKACDLIVKICGGNFRKI